MSEPVIEVVDLDRTGAAVRSVIGAGLRLISLCCDAGAVAAGVVAFACDLGARAAVRLATAIEVDDGGGAS